MDPNYQNQKGRDEVDKITFGRRKLLHILATGSGVFAALTILPDRWSQPIIEFVVLPAHAQTSNPEPPSEPLPADPLPPSPTTYTLAASANPLNGPTCWVESIMATMSPAVAGVEIEMTVSGTGPVAPPNSFTNSAGVANFPDVSAMSVGEFSLIFSFVDPAYGSQTATLGPYQEGAC